MFDEKSRHRALSTENDFLELIIQTYQSKNAGVKRFMLDGHKNSIEEKHSSTREIVKCFKGIEACVVPILSVLNLQLQRSLFLKKSWLYPDEVTNLDPSDHGYRREKDGTFSVNLQDVTDPFYSLPRSLLKGCSCRTSCLNKKCSCVKDEQGKKCSKVTCRCKCFDHRQIDDEDREEEEEHMEVDVEDDCQLEEIIKEVENSADDTDDDSNASFSCDESYSDEEYVPFRFDRTDMDDFLD